MLSLFYSRNYRCLFSATGISNLGDGVSALAFPWLATLITRDPLLIALVGFAARLPWLLFSIPAGVWTDRADRQRLMVQADLFRFALTAGIVAVLLTTPEFPPDAGVQYILGLAGLAFLLGSAEVLRDNAAQTILPSVVDKDRLERANGQLWSVEQVMGAFVGPPLAGLLIAYAVPAPFFLDAATFLIAAVLVWCMRLSAQPNPARQERSWIKEAREGAAWLWSHRVILQLALMLGVFNFANMLVLTVLPLFGQELLGLNAAQYGMLLAVEAAGGVLGGLICPAIAARLGGRMSLLLSLLLCALAYLAIGLSPTLWVTAPALFVVLFAGLLWNVVTVSYRQRLIPDVLLGRVNSLYRFFGWGLLALGALAGGALVKAFEQPLGRELALCMPFLCAAAITGLILVYALRALRL